MSDVPQFMERGLQNSRTSIPVHFLETQILGPHFSHAESRACRGGAQPVECRRVFNNHFSGKKTHICVHKFIINFSDKICSTQFTNYNMKYLIYLVINFMQQVYLYRTLTLVFASFCIRDNLSLQQMKECSSNMNAG